jgi:predicted transcriptional regulator
MARPTPLNLDDALERRVEARPEETQEALRQETVQAWEEFQATGLHATAEEVERWLSSWGSADGLAAPESHE